MKAKKVTFTHPNSDGELKYDKAFAPTITEALKHMLFMAVNFQPTRDSAQEQRKWDALDALRTKEGVASNPTVLFETAVFDILCDLWGKAMPNVQQDYRWKKAIQECLNTAETIEIEDISQIRNQATAEKTDLDGQNQPAQ